MLHQQRKVKSILCSKFYQSSHDVICIVLQGLVFQSTFSLWRLRHQLVKYMPYVINKFILSAGHVIFHLFIEAGY